VEKKEEEDGDKQVEDAFVVGLLYPGVLLEEV
jgi:hypothetical protein